MATDLLKYLFFVSSYKRSTIKRGRPFLFSYLEQIVTDCFKSLTPIHGLPIIISFLAFINTYSKRFTTDTFLPG